MRGCPSTRFMMREYTLFIVFDIYNFLTNSYGNHFPLLTAHICTSSKCSCTFGPKLCRVNVRLPEQSIFLIILCNQLYPEWKLSLIDTGRRFPSNKEPTLKKCLLLVALFQIFKCLALLEVVCLFLCFSFLLNSMTPTSFKVFHSCFLLKAKPDLLWRSVLLSTIKR